MCSTRPLNPASYFVCCLILGLALMVGFVCCEDIQSCINTNNDDNATSTQLIPQDLLNTFGAYPNLLELDNQDRADFHPVLLVPNGTSPVVVDCRKAKGLASPGQLQLAKRQNQWWRRRLTRPLKEFGRRVIKHEQRTNESTAWSIGRYDENREAMYSSELFQDPSNRIEGFAGKRTVHLGIDLGGPVGTPVHAFTEGVVHSVGYNADFGDYGYVIVIQHPLPSDVKVWALYGHLDKSTVRGQKPGTEIWKGQVIGRLGDCHENGGWETPHVHFQLSVTPPVTHDMPGASSVQDRPKALLNYPDPRYVLGPIY